MSGNSGKKGGFSTQKALETGMGIGVSTVEVTSAVVLFFMLLVGSIALQLVDVITGAMGWSKVFAEVQGLTIMGRTISGGTMALMVEAGPDAISSLLIGTAAAYLRRKKGFTLTGALVLALGFGLIIHVGDAVKDYYFAVDFLEPAVRQVIATERQGIMLQLGAGLIGFVSLAGNAALPGLLAFARMTIDRFEEEHSPGPVHGAAPAGQHMPLSGAQPAGFRPPVQAAPPADAPAGEHGAPQGGVRPPMPGGTGRLPGVPHGQPVQNRPPTTGRR